MTFLFHYGYFLIVSPQSFPSPTVSLFLLSYSVLYLTLILGVQLTFGLFVTKVLFTVKKTVTTEFLKQ